MNNNLTTFHFQNHAVRTVTDEHGEPRFVAKDVCDILGLENITEALRGLDDDELTSEILKSGGQGREMRLVNESGLYALIFKSRKPEAKAFRKWVTSEVLPAIRKTGGYVQANPDDTPEAIMARAVLVAQNTIEQQKATIDGQQEQITRQQAQIEDMKPKAQFADAITASEGCILVRELAKILKQRGLNIGGNQLFEVLRETGYLIKQKSIDRDMPTQKSMEKGLFEVQEYNIPQKNGKKLLRRVTRVTPHGQRYFINLFLTTDFYLDYWKEKLDFWNQRVHELELKVGKSCYETAMETGEFPEDDDKMNCLKMYIEETGKSPISLIFSCVNDLFKDLDFSVLFAGLKGTRR